MEPSTRHDVVGVARGEPVRMSIGHDLIRGMRQLAPFLDAVLKEVEVARRMNPDESIGRPLCGFN